MVVRCQAPYINSLAAFPNEYVAYAPGPYANATLISSILIRASKCYPVRLGVECRENIRPLSCLILPTSGRTAESIGKAPDCMIEPVEAELSEAELSATNTLAHESS